jgi:hypothetical protein
VCPIRCKKIRYYADRHFSKRLLPPPPRPRGQPLKTMDPRGASGSLDADLPPLGDGFEPEGPLTLTHEASIDDIERIDSLTLDDFGDRVKNLKFQHAGDRPTESEFSADVAMFMDALP